MMEARGYDAAKRLFGRKNRKNTLPGIAGWGFLILSAALSAIGLWTHFYKVNSPLTAAYKDDSVYVTASYGKEAQIPADAELRACAVTPETDGAVYEKKLASAMAAAGGDGEAAPANAIYNVGFYVGEKEIEPAAPVDVTLQSRKGGFAAGEAVKVIHLGESDAQVISDTRVDEKGFISFTSDEFSDFVFVSEEEKEEKTEEVETDGIRVTVKYGPEANIPEGAELKAERILPEGDTEEYYTRRLEEADEIYKEQTGEDNTQVFTPLALLNVGFYLSDGSEVSPAAPVTVTVQFLDETGAAAGDPITVIHFADTGAETLEGDDVSEENATAFTVSSFSNFFIGTPSPINTPGTAFISGAGSNAREFEHNKYIDYLGDNEAGTGTDNKDTEVDNEQTVKDDLYRLYLDMTGECEPIDLVIVIDRSNSMKEDMGGKSRWQTVYDILEGTNSEGTDGLLYKFLKVNEGKTSDEERNFVSMVWFAGEYYDRNASNQFGCGTYNIPPNSDKEGGTVFGWTSEYKHQSTTNYEISPHKGVSWGVACTNYVAGFYQADQMLQKAPQNHKKVVVFMSDGIPVYYYQATDMDWDDPTGMSRYGGGAEAYTYTDYKEEKNKKTKVTDIFRRNGKGDPVKNYYDSPYFSETLKIFKGEKNSFVTRNPNISFYTVAIDLEKEAINGCDRTTLLKDMVAAYKGAGGSMYSANDAKGLEKFLQQIMFPAGVTISDDLSAYVDLYKDPDILVTATLKVKEGSSVENPVTLWKGPASGFSVDAGNVVQNGETYQLNGADVIKNVTYDSTTKTIAVHFVDDYCLSNEYTYTLSFNVQLTAKAYDDYAELKNKDATAPGYNKVVGDVGTDYGTNSTSSGKPGFRSNDKATVEYMINKQKGSTDYKYPVVQAWGSTFGFTKFKEPDVSFSESEEEPGGEPQTEVFSNVPFRLERRDSVNDKIIIKDCVIPCGGTYESKKSDGKYYYLTDTSGMIQYGYLPGGTYNLYELVPSGYIGEDVETLVLTFTVEKGRITSMQKPEGIEAVWPPKEGDSDFPIKIEETNSTPNASYGIAAEEVKITNTPATKRIAVYKRDKSGNAVKGAEFKLYSAAEEPAGEGVEKQYTEVEELGNSTSHEDGLLFEGEIGYGLYILKETNAPDTYEILEDPIVFQVDKEGGVTVLANEKHCEIEEKSSDGDTVFTLNITNRKLEVAIDLKKIESGSDTAGEPVYLEGAEFELYAGENFKNKNLLWTGTSTAEGKFKDTMPDGADKFVPFPELTSGTEYYLVEKKAPAGYNILGYSIKLTVKCDGTVVATPVDAAGEVMKSGNALVNVIPKNNKDETGNLIYSVEITVSNNSGYELPETGGPGTILYLLSGLILVFGSAVVLFAKRRSL